MSKIMFVGSVDDLAYQEGLAQGFAAAGIRPWQRYLRRGDCFVRFEEGFAIYSEVLEDSSSDYRFTVSYSIMNEYGEMGDVHISTAFKVITRAQFQAFRSKGWPAHEDSVRMTLTAN